MSRFDDQELSLAKVYALSFLALAKERGELERIGEELREFGSWLEVDPGVAHFLSSPMVDEDRRRDLLEKALRGRASDTFVDALQVMNRNGRLSLVEAVAQAYHTLYEEHLGRVEAFVRTAAAISPAHQTRLRDVIARRTGKEVDLVIDLDESLIGGLVVRINDEKLDASVARKLAGMADNLTKRAAREVLQASVYVEGLAV